MLSIFKNVSEDAGHNMHTSWPEHLESCEIDCAEKEIYPETRYRAKRVTLTGNALYTRKLMNAHFRHCEFRGDIDQIDFGTCSFYECRFMSGSREHDGGISRCRFENCDFERCTFSHIKFAWTSWLGGQVRSCSFDMRCVIEGIEFKEVAELHTCYGLHFARDDSNRAGQMRLAVQLRLLELPLSDFVFSWERLRTVGRLPLFGASFVALIAIPSIIFLLAVYNEQARRIADIATKHPDLPAHILESLRAVHEVPIPHLTFLTLIATLLLGIASSIFTLLCPSRIKEFSADRWFDELQQSAINYVPLSWTHRMPRLIAGVCYSIGGVIAIYVLLSKLYNAGAYILAYTHAPWWLR